MSSSLFQFLVLVYIIILFILVLSSIVILYFILKLINSANFFKFSIELGPFLLYVLKKGVTLPTILALLGLVSFLKKGVTLPTLLGMFGLESIKKRA